MGNKSKYSIGKREEHFIYDSNKIEAFQDCPRRFFFRYVLGWKSEFPNIHAAFGSAWREAISFLIARGMTDSYVQKACNIFDDIFYERCPQDLHGKHPSKNAENARNGLREYAKGFRMMGDSEVLSTDVAGKVAISNDRVLYFKCDHISRNSEGQIWGLEHKTTSQGGSSWKNRWGLDFQTNAQSYAVSRLFEEKKGDVAGIKIDGAILRSDSNNEFIRIPCRKSVDQLQLWKQECNYWIDLIEQNWKILGETNISQNTMYAFPRNPTSCTKSGCRFEDMCEHWCNPLRHCENPPIGYEEDHHDPRNKEATANNVVSVG